MTFDKILKEIAYLIYSSHHVKREDWNNENWENPGPVRSEYLIRAESLIEEVNGDVDKAKRIIELLS